MRTPYRYDPEQWPDSDDGPVPAEAPYLEVEVSDNPIVGTLLGADGLPLLHIYEREPIGFRLR